MGLLAWQILSGKAMGKCFLLESQGISTLFMIALGCIFGPGYFRPVAPISHNPPCQKQDPSVYLGERTNYWVYAAKGTCIWVWQRAVRVFGHLTCLLSELKGIAPKFTIKIHSYTICPDKALFWQESRATCSKWVGHGPSGLPLDQSLICTGQTCGINFSAVSNSRLANRKYPDCLLM